MADILLFDVNYLAHRSWHTTGGLEYQGIPTGVAYGVLHTILELVNLHDAKFSVMAFDDRGKSLRREIYPNYKKTRYSKELSPEELDAVKLLHDQVDSLKDEYLPGMGFKNNFRVAGYEGDDIIAEAVNRIPESKTAIIVSSDQDMYQCIRNNVMHFNPTTKACINIDVFRKTWGIEPCQWPSVKALAGCKSDDVAGIRGVGEVTAARYLSGELTKGKKYEDIQKNIGLMHKNLPIVELPFPGIRVPPIKKDDVTEKKIRKVHEALGIRTSRRSSRAAKKDKLIKQGFDV